MEGMGFYVIQEIIKRIAVVMLIIAGVIGMIIFLLWPTEYTTTTKIKPSIIIKISNEGVVDTIYTYKIPLFR